MEKPYLLTLQPKNNKTETIVLDTVNNEQQLSVKSRWIYMAND